MKNAIVIFLFLGFLARAGTSPGIIFKENKGQWPDKVLFGAEFLNTKFYVNKAGFNYCIYNPEELSKVFGGRNQDAVIHGHNYEVEFMGADLSQVVKNNEQPEYYNYFLGNDKSKWASGVKAYQALQFISVYEGIDLKLYSQQLNLKYDFVVKPGAEASDIKLSFKHVEGIEIRDNNLVILTSVGEIVEKKPYAYQVIGGIKREVECKYELAGSDMAGFAFPFGYDKNYELIIDPIVIACSYGGAPVFSYGYSCTGDANGNIFNAAGSDIGYPSTAGAFQVSSAGFGDIVINKFNSTGTSKIFATFIGGSDNEYATEIQVNNTDITLIGITSSANYPVSANAFDGTLGGLNDIVISKLDLSGSGLLASTYIGGSSRENIGQFPFPGFPSIGMEMAIDKQKNIYAVSNSLSSDFPVTPGALSATRQGN